MKLCLYKILEAQTEVKGDARTYLLGILGGMSNIAIIIYRPGMMSESKTIPAIACFQGHVPFFLLLSRNAESIADMGRRDSEIRTLHDASILCNVTQTATTLSTGDHSLPRMEAHI